jgi:hypothetical protein
LTTPVYPGTTIPVATAVSLVQLAGRGGTTISLIPGERNSQYAWSPFVRDPNTGGEKPIASDIDLQMMWVEAEKPINNAPLVYWRVEYGHGETVYGLPMVSSLGAAAPELFNTQGGGGWMLPQRGLRLRLPARQLRITFFTPTMAEPPPEPAVPGGAPCKLQVSVQPCSGLHPQQLPVTDALFGQSLVVPPVVPAQLPLGATEMRLCDPTDGGAFGAGEQVAFYDITGAPAGLGPVNMALFANWTPIPIFAAFWASDQAAQVSYR